MSEAVSLWAAAKAGNELEVEKILADKHVDVNTVWEKNGGSPINVSDDKLERYFGSTPLWVAADEGYSEIVKLLLAHPSIQVNKTNSNGASPFRVASQFGHD